jgi:lantibiotic modifying enzyme
LDHAISAGNWLVKSAETIDNNKHRWKIPAGYNNLSNLSYFGYAHGAAGIADTLLDLYQITGQKKYCSAVIGTGRWLSSNTVKIFEDKSGINWPQVRGEMPIGAFWCHGATGIGRFFLHAAKLEVIPEASTLAIHAAKTVINAGRNIGPSQCHGLSGNIDFLLDMYQYTNNKMYLYESHQLARLLKVFVNDWVELTSKKNPSSVVNKNRNKNVQLSGWENHVDPGYMTGYSGVMLCLLRLSDMRHDPNQIIQNIFN